MPVGIRVVIGHELIKAAVDKKLHVGVLKLIDSTDKGLARPIDRKVEGHALAKASDIVGGRLERRVADAAHDREIRPEPLEKR